ncbi:unnamed protein product [Phytomonas sp. Hart1]|nr:unnamed protein product [Phytomonas sp. Hart1]|eukprot:CCW70192.1 unnamed protein product [Phytomonas sp. isolate Hart1]
MPHFTTSIVVDSQTSSIRPSPIDIASTPFPHRYEPKMIFRHIQSRFVLCHVLLLLCVMSFAVGGTEVEQGVSLYGLLQVPESYFSHPDSENPLNQVQPGSVLLTSALHNYRVPVQKGGLFVVPRVAYGTYLLQAEFHDFIFPTVLLEVRYIEDEQTHRQEKPGRVPVVLAYANDFSMRPLEGTGVDDINPIIIPEEGIHLYHVPRQEFHIMDILKNPMIIMMLVSFAMFGIVKLFPEEDLKESQKVTREWQNKLLSSANKGIGNKAAE